MKRNCLLVLLILLSMFFITACSDGKNGKSAYELYKENHPEYTKTEEEWLDDLVNDRLGKKESFTVTFDCGKGIEIKPQVIEKFGRITKPEDPIKEGYDFIGWFIKDEEVSFIHYLVTEDTTVTAKYTVGDWEIKSNMDLSKALYVGDKIKLDFKVLPESVNQELVFDSNNTDVCVIEDGYLIIKNAGFSYINVRSKENESCFLDFYIEAYDKNNLPFSIDSNGKTTLTHNETINLYINSDSFITVKKWSVDNETLATIDGFGELKALTTDGVVKVFAELDNGVIIEKEFTIKK